MEDHKEQLTPEIELANAQERVAELEQDIRCFAFVTYEIMKMFGITIDQIMKDELKMNTVMKSIKSRLLEAMTDEDGFKALFKHFADDAVYVGLKYKDLAEELSAKKSSK